MTEQLQVKDKLRLQTRYKTLIDDGKTHEEAAWNIFRWFVSEQATDKFKILVGAFLRELAKGKDGS